MLWGAIYKFRIWKLLRDKRSIEKKFGKKIKTARTKKASEDAIDRLIEDERFESDLISDEIQSLHSRYLTRQASVLDIPIPKFTKTGPGYEKWTQSEVTGRYRLSNEARHDLRALVEAAAKAKRESWTWWVPIIFGLIGAITGLMAVWEKAHPAPPPSNLVYKIPISEAVDR